ncbi:hypothetical protein LTR36_004576 [Oleoguttula mirabilis]|uniref:RNA polymerase II subunit B1 CTD phosphatase RPAP2 homolog n=1 Tax=Oleoguttula mirabilis TaxID=1507867 RepID=A0AAV9JGH3_9PEZI|nr:hypothetical protein LTR36_004576 [Oleoguttula mirabilis]
MATKVPVKSILKQPAPPKPTDEDKAKAEKDRHNLNLALQHAYLIQHQKDVQAQILTSIETLLDLPSSPIFTAQDANTLISLVQQFQPSDLDALAEERRIDGRCGYALCANAPRYAKLGESASWKLSKGASDFCSAACARKSLYVKTQLGEVPAWERDPTRTLTIKLHQDDRPVEDQAPDGKSRVSGRQVANDGNDLALERGEKTASLRPAQVMTDRIVEKRTVAHKPLSSLSNTAVSHTAIEGYEPRRTALSGKREDSDDSDDDDNDDDHDDKMAEELFDGVDE